MASYRVILSRQAESVYRWLYQKDRKLFARIRAVLESLSVNPLQGKPLKGPLSGLLSYRVGSYRIIFRIVHRELRVHILDIGHRREIYH
ncbi:type II toxin-antitoxin system RelE/ParE family toxin [Elusimicrobiota bacterium]